ncbi:MAG: LysR family transcriptional regulator [Undibacterium sp.]|nr:LysR family transcriptional regulator [Undibacterium sp.]
MTKLRWDDLALFLAVAQQGSLSGAARTLRLGQPTLSRRIAELEEAVGEALFERKSSGIRLTEAGEKLLPACERMAEWAHQAQQNIHPQSTQIEGKVRIAAPPAIAYEFLAPLANKLRLAYPRLSIEVLSGLETLNLSRGEADISLRTNAPTDQDLICVDQVTTQIKAYAAKSYIQLRAQCRSTQQQEKLKFEDLDWICWAEPYGNLYVNQTLKALIPDFKPAFTSDDYIVQLAACRAGVGVMPLAKALHRYSLLNELQELDLDLGSAAVGSLYMVVHKRHQHLAKVRCVVEMISQEFAYLRSLSTV